jgi:uncharacterized protein (TIGR02001 family)
MPDIRRLALLGCLLAPSGAAAWDVHAAVGGVSDYVVHGLSRSDEDPALQAELSLASETGTVAGVWASSAQPNPSAGRELELAPFLGHRFRIGLDWSVDATLSRYLYSGDDDVLSYDYTELRAGVAYRDMVELAVAWSPDWTLYSYRGPASDRRALWTELSAGIPFDEVTRLSLGVGYADVSAHVGKGYAYYSGGLEWRWRRLLLGLTWVGTDSSGEGLFGDQRAGDRLVASVIWNIR